MMIVCQMEMFTVEYPKVCRDKTERPKAERGMCFLGGTQPLPTSYGVWGAL